MVPVGLIAGRHSMPFSSPLGVGLVLTNNGYINRNLIFSSPSGDGLVHFHTGQVLKRMKSIFVPAWGWVGSYQ